jgi:hypothetical protein
MELVNLTPCKTSSEFQVRLGKSNIHAALSIPDGLVIEQLHFCSWTKAGEVET